MMTTRSAMFEILDAYMGGPFKWGKEDCLIGCANVFRELHGPDLAASVRGYYGSEEDASAILEYGYQGSLLTFLEEQALELGVQRSRAADSPAPIGAIGVTQRGVVAQLDGRTTCIHTGNGIWATKALRGYALAAKAEVYWYV